MEKIEEGKIKTPFVRSKDQLADVFSKAVSSTNLKEAMVKLNVKHIYAQLEGKCEKAIIVGGVICKIPGPVRIMDELNGSYARNSCVHHTAKCMKIRSQIIGSIHPCCSSSEPMNLR